MVLKFQSPSVRVARLCVPQKVESHSQVDSVNSPPLGPDEPSTELCECPCGEPTSTMGNRSWAQCSHFPGGLADILSCVGPRPFCHQVALLEWSLWSADTQFDPFGVDSSPPVALSSCLWWLITSTHGLNVAPVQLGFACPCSIIWPQWKNPCTRGVCALGNLSAICTICWESHLLVQGVD